MKRRLFRLWSILLTLSPDGSATALVYPGTPMDTVVYTYGDPDWGDLLIGYDAAGTPMTLCYNGVLYYYVTNAQGDVVAILDAQGYAVVTYTYEAWGNHLSISGSLASTLGLQNPLRYRGYVYDQDTGLYYLQSRYYNPVWGRFINGDAFASTGQGFLGFNMYAYCLNNPSNRLDSTGCDAIWIQEKKSAGTMGHTGLIVEDKVGNWWYYFWGPADDTIRPELISGTNGLFIFIPLDTRGIDMRNKEGVKQAIGNCDQISSRAALTTDIIYLPGDYTPTFNFLYSELEAHNAAAGNTNMVYSLVVSLQYTLLDNNCVKRTWNAFEHSNINLIGQDCPIIPNIAFHRFSGLLTNYRYNGIQDLAGKSFNFRPLYMQQAR